MTLMIMESQAGTVGLRYGKFGLGLHVRFHATMYAFVLYSWCVTEFERFFPVSPYKRSKSQSI